MRYLGLLRGLPSSGKTSFIKEHNLEPFTLSSDDYRLKLASPTLNMNGKLSINQEVSGRAWKNLKADLEYRMSNGEFTIIDATNISEKEVNNYRNLCKKYFYHMFIVDFTDVTADTCKSRDEHRGWHTVGSDVIDRMNTKLQNAIISSSIKTIKPNEFNDYIYDIYNPISLNSYNNVYVIGDIHGCYTALKTAMTNFDYEKDAVIFTGDYFDRGIENAEVFKFLYDIKDNKNVFMCIGNHDQRIFKYLRDEDVSHTQFYKNTLEQFKNAGINNKMLRSFCRSLITCAWFIYNYNEYIVTHGGISTRMITPLLSDNTYVYGTGNYGDMNDVCDTFVEGTNVIQIFGHRNNDDVDIKINEYCYNVCGFPEYGGSLKHVVINENGITSVYTQNDIIDNNLRYKAIEKYPDRFKITEEDAINLFRHSKYVSEHKFGEISSFNFSKDAFYDDIWNGATVKARGIFFNTKTNKIVARSYDKFFLLNQHECSTIDNFKFPLTCYEKYDGYLGILGYDKSTNELVFCSKSMKAPEGEYAQWFKDEMLKRIKDIDMLKQAFKGSSAKSLIFEVIIPDKDEHLIKYDKTEIVLLDMVHNTIDFDLYEYKIACNFANAYITDFKTKAEFPSFYDKHTFNFYLKSLKEQSGEGFVFVDADKHMFKLKTYEYEIAKLTRSQQEYYDNIVERNPDVHDIKCPTYEHIRDRYIEYFDTVVVEAVYDNIVSIVKETNQKLVDKHNSVML